MPDPIYRAPAPLIDEQYEQIAGEPMPEPTTENRSSVCDTCGGPIAITIVVGEQRWHDVDWQHTDPQPNTRHRAVPELRLAIDATCPGCGFPEIGYAPAREEFTCSRCGHTTTERPKD